MPRAAEGAGPFVTRFAPSPTGRLHRGHAFSALCAWTAAQVAGGRFLLRIEDIDRFRCRPEFEAAILDDLTWLDLTWRGPVRRQSEHFSDYQGALERLKDRGLLYRCFRTRAEAMADIGRAPHEASDSRALRPWRGGPEPPAREARFLAEGRPFAWRLSIAAAQSCPELDQPLSFLEEGDSRGAGRGGRIEVDPVRLDDVVLARKDLGVSYHLAVSVDDALQGVTHVIRGADLYEATAYHRLLQALLGLPTPRYRHHRLLLGPDGRRYAKRDHAQTLGELRARGLTAPALRAELGFS